MTTFLGEPVKSKAIQKLLKEKEQFERLLKEKEQFESSRKI